jgi:hypothetical protein
MIYYIKHISGMVINSPHYQHFNLTTIPLLFTSLKSLRTHVNTVDNKHKCNIEHYKRYRAQYPGSDQDMRYPELDPTKAYYTQIDKFFIQKVDFETMTFHGEMPLSLVMSTKDLKKLETS